MKALAERRYEYPMYVVAYSTVVYTNVFVDLFILLSVCETSTGLTINLRPVYQNVHSLPAQPLQTSSTPQPSRLRNLRLGNVHKRRSVLCNIVAFTSVNCCK